MEFRFVGIYGGRKVNRKGGNVYDAIIRLQHFSGN